MYLCVCVSSVIIMHLNLNIQIVYIDVSTIIADLQQLPITRLKTRQLH